MSKYCIIVTVLNTDKKQDLKTLMEGVDSKLIGRDAEPTDPDFFNRYVIGTQNVAALDLAGEEISASVMIGYNQNVLQSVAVELAKQSPAYRQVSFNPPETREVIVSRLRQLAGQDGCEKLWVLKPGDSTLALTTIDLLANFQEL